MGRESDTSAAAPERAQPAAGGKFPLPVVLLILGGIALLLQLQSGAISLPPPKPKDAATQDSPSAATFSTDPSAFPPEPDYDAARQALDARAAVREANERRSFQSADALARMDCAGAARLLAQWPPEQAAAALYRLPARQSGPILDEADPALAAQWLGLLASPEALPELRPEFAALARDSGWQGDYPQEDLSAPAASASGDVAAEAAAEGAAGEAPATQDDTQAPPAAGASPAAENPAPVEGAGETAGLIG
ncbi:hypothetical protein IT575_15565 [bacterium]|nr:hypothetical protein [bacterium]